MRSIPLSPRAPDRQRSAVWQAGKCRAILRRLGSLHFVGMDVVEVAPPYDVAEITALAAATIVWEYLALIGGSPLRR